MTDASSAETRHLHLQLPTAGGTHSGLIGRNAWTIALALVAIGVLFVPVQADALEIGKYIALAVAFFFHILVSLVGQILLLLVSVLIWIAQYNGFVNSTPVANGWTIVRDIANMFFIIGLLIIAFGTMLGLGSKYHYSSALPRLLIMAIVVNFSRTICGLIIDFAQVVMLTFVNGFKEAAGGNFVDAFQLSSLMQIAEPTDDSNQGADLLWNTALQLILAFILLSVASFVIVVMIAVLIVRIVFLWLLIVLSPLAFVSSAIPVGKSQSFYGEWWQKFNDQVLVGPFMAFFLWIALISVAAGDIDGEQNGFAPYGGSNETVSNRANSALAMTEIQKYIIAIGLLLGGLAMAQQMSGKATSFATGAMGGAKNLAWKATKWGAKKGYAASGAERAVDRAKERTYTGLGKIPGLKGFTTMAAKQRQTMAKKADEDKELLGYMSNSEINKLTKSSSLDPRMRGMKANAIKEKLKRVDAGKDTIEGKTEEEKAHNYNRLRNEAKRMDALIPGQDMDKAVRDHEKKNFAYIVDPASQGEQRQEQVDRFKKNSSKATAKTISEIDGDQWKSGAGEKMAMTMDANNMARATREMDATKKSAMFKAAGLSDDQIGKIETATNIEDKAKIIRSAQDELKKKPENFEYLNDNEKAEKMAAEGGGSYSLEQMAGINMENLNAGQKEAVMAEISAKVQSPEDLNKLPKEIRDAVVDGMKQSGDNDQYLKMGGDLGEVLKGVDMTTGMADQEGRANLYEKMHDADIGENSAYVDERALASNDGINDYSMALIENLKQDKYDPATGEVTEKGDIRKLIESGDLGKVRAIMQAANGLETGNAMKLMESQAASMKKEGKSDQEVESFRNGFLERHSRAQEAARNLRMQAGGGLQAEMSGMTFAGRAGRVARAGGSAVAGGYRAVRDLGQQEAGEALKKAAREAGQAIAKGAKAGAEATVEGAKAAGRLTAEGANRVQREARRRGGSIKGRAGQFRRKIW